MVVIPAPNFGSKGAAAEVPVSKLTPKSTSVQPSPKPTAEIRTHEPPKEDPNTWPFRIGFSTCRRAASDPQARNSTSGEVQVVAYDTARRLNTRLTIRPFLLLLLLFFLGLFGLTVLSFLAILLSVAAASFISSTTSVDTVLSFQRLNPLLLTLLFAYSLFKQLMDWLRGLGRPRQRLQVEEPIQRSDTILATGRRDKDRQDGRHELKDPVHQSTIKSWWSIWNEKDRPR